jgi:C-5 cytosine-specific DNA methylase
MNIAVLFDGCGLARLGLEMAGHTCTGYELDPNKHYLSQFIGSGRCVLQDATSVDLSPYDAVWASPPCQFLSIARTQGQPISPYATDLLAWSLALVKRYPDKTVWVENVLPSTGKTSWGKSYNAAQFLARPGQNRPRCIGGHYTPPTCIGSFNGNTIIYGYVLLLPQLSTRVVPAMTVGLAGSMGVVSPYKSVHSFKG